MGNPGYKAFMSYSHAADGRLAPALQSALHRFVKPWYRLRTIRVFRDKTSLSANPALWPSIEMALNDSEYFLLLASPEAAGIALGAERDRLVAGKSLHSKDAHCPHRRRACLGWNGPGF